VTSPYPDYQPEVDQGETASDDGLSVETSPGNDSLSSTGANSYSGSPTHSGHLAMDSESLIRDRPMLSQSTLTLTSEVDCEAYRLDDVEQTASSQTGSDPNGRHVSERGM